MVQTGFVRSALLAAAAVALLLPSAGCHARRKVVIEDNQQLLDHAQDLIARRHLLEAVQVLGDAGLVTPVTEQLDPLIKLALADAYFYQAGTVNVVEAQGRYEQFLSFYPTHQAASYARYQIGACLFEQSQRPTNDQEYPRRALEHFQKMASELPASDPWGMAARVMAARSQDSLAEHEWLVGMYYFGRGRWPGAIGRLTHLIDQFPEAVRREQAFYQLGLAFAAAGDLEQAKLTWRRQLSEYPAGAHAHEAQARLAPAG